MPESGAPGTAGVWERVLPHSDEPGTLPDLYDSELAHLFDYCRALLGQDGEAIRTARSVLDSPHEQLPDRQRRRAWLFGLARSLAFAWCPPGSDEPAYLPRALMAASIQDADEGVLQAFRALSGRDREILDLVYRHGIRPADLSAVLIVPADEAYRCLAIAEDEFINLTAGLEAGSGAGLEEIAAVPLAAVPAAEGSEPQPEDRPARQPEDAPLQRPSARRPVRLAALAVTAVAAMLGGVVLVAMPSQPARSNSAVRSGAGHADHRAGTHGSLSAQSRQRSAAGQPVASPSAIAAPTSSPSDSAITGLAAAVKPVPCPPGTKANFRWHYAANGSAGGWSGTATKPCPGSVTMGPQAMGNLQVTPGTALAAGYDFTLPKNTNPLTMTVSAAHVTFTVSCVSKAVPTAPTLTVPLQAQTYQITGAQWYPSGDQSSPLVYQGSILVPALCGPGGAISLSKGGTFTAALG